MLTAVIFILPLILLLILRKKLWKGLDIPGPKGLPVIGNAMQLMSQTPYLQLQSWSKTYGAVFKIRYFLQDIVVLNDNDVIREALLEKSEDFAGRPPLWRMNYIVPGGNRDIGHMDYCDDLKRIKKITHHGLKQFGDGMDRIAALALDEIQDCIARFKSHDGVPFDPRESIEQCFINIMTGLLLGESIDKTSEEFRTVCFLVDSLERCGPAGPGSELEMFPWLRFLGNESYKILTEHIKKHKMLFSAWMKRAEKKVSLQSGESLYSITEVLHQYYQRGELSRDEVHGIIWDILLAGVTTTVSNMKTLLLILANRPDIEKKIQNEIDNNIGNRLPTIKDRQNMPYTVATILEILRYGSTLTLYVPHKTMCDTSVGGYHVPNGTTVWINAWALQHDDKYFPEPNKFKVERFLDDDGNLLPVNERKSFLPFGLGKRECVGEAMAKVRMFLFVSSLLQKLDVLPEDKNNPPDPDPTKFIHAVTNQPGPFKIIVKERK